MKSLAKALEITPKTSRAILEVRLESLAREDMNYYNLYWVAYYGIQWGIQTARFSGMIVNKLDSLNCVEFCKLLEEVNNNVPNMGEVPRYVIQKFC